MDTAMTKLNWPPGYTIEMRGDMTQMMDSFGRLLVGLQFAVGLIFLLLVAQFRGFLQPLQMIFSLPLELAGVFTALWLAHQAFSTVSIMAVSYTHLDVYKRQGPSLANNLWASRFILDLPHADCGSCREAVEIRLGHEHQRWFH